MNDKITAPHPERSAYIYIRQSTLQQVHHNVERNRWQYALAERARSLGFASVVVVDEDLGISGAGNRERPGFTRLLAAVCNGPARATPCWPGRCGQKLRVGYRGRGGRGAAHYICEAGTRERGEQGCLSFGGLRVEHAIVAKVLRSQ